MPVIVELFTSEGCNACPPADDYLRRLDGGQPVPGVAVVALELHVDYWDEKGWKDPFSQAEYSDRQRQYARTLADHRVFTPLVLIDGWGVVQNGDEAQAARMMQESAKKPRAAVALKQTGDRLEIEIERVLLEDPNDSAEVWLAVSESGLETAVGAGENSGRRLRHAPVARDLRKLATLTGASYRGHTTLTRAWGWQKAALRTIVWVQAAGSRRILGAAAL